MVNAIRCAVLRLLCCFHGRALFCFACIAYIGMLICFLVIGVLFFLYFYIFYSTLLSCDILDGLADGWMGGYGVREKATYRWLGFNFLLLLLLLMVVVNPEFYCT